jgi:hypothetical protein
MMDAPPSKGLLCLLWDIFESRLEIFTGYHWGKYLLNGGMFVKLFYDCLDCTGKDLRRVNG